MRTIVVSLVGVAALVAGVGTLHGCARDVSLCAVPDCLDEDPGIPDDKLLVDGRVCTIDPTSLLFPYKILFVIDISGSTDVSDPNGGRARAVQAVIDEYIENRAAEFAIITFNNQAQRATPGFTREYDVLVSAVNGNLLASEDATNYLDALRAAYELIEEDATTAPPSERARTRYDIQWLSDGIPDPCQTPETVLGQAKSLYTLQEALGIFNITLSTVRLYHRGYPVEGCESQTPDYYLQPMAELGGGSFEMLDGDDLAFQIDFTEVFRRYVQNDFYVVNENRVVVGDRLLPDTDTDGIPDVDDPEPLVADPYGSGCTDAVIWAIRPNPASLCVDSCRESVSKVPAGHDTDNDGVVDCAEQLLGSDRMVADTDEDGFDDLLELRFGTGIADAGTPERNSDRDQVLDAEEIRLGTNPNFPEIDDAFAYRYGPLTPVDSEIPGVDCFSFAVDNVRLAQTAATESAAEGANNICVYLVQSHPDQPLMRSSITRACKVARYGVRDGEEIRIPANGVLTFEPEDFELHAGGEMRDEELDDPDAPSDPTGSDP